MSDNVPVRFAKAWRAYFPGDIAGFASEVSEALIGAGVASAYSVKADQASKKGEPAGKKSGSRAPAAKSASVSAVTDPSGDGSGIPVKTPETENTGPSEGAGPVGEVLNSDGNQDDPPDVDDDEKP